MTEVGVPALPRQNAVTAKNYENRLFFFRDIVMRLFILLRGQIGKNLPFSAFFYEILIAKKDVTDNKTDGFYEQ